MVNFSDDDYRVLDRMQIQEVMARYARAVDRRDWTAFSDTFHPDAVDNHGPYNGPIAPLVELLKKRHEHVVSSMHVLGNCIIDFVGLDLALVETYFNTYQRLAPEAGDDRIGFLRGQTVRDDEDVEVQVVGRYVDKFTRRKGRWRVAHRTVVYEIYRGQPAPRGGGLNSSWVLSRRDGQDAVEVQLREHSSVKPAAGKP